MKIGVTNIFAKSFSKKIFDQLKNVNVISYIFLLLISETADVALATPTANLLQIHKFDFRNVIQNILTYIDNQLTP